MFIKIKDIENMEGYINVNSVEFIRINLDKSVELFFIGGKNGLKVLSENAKPLIDYLKSSTINEIN